MGGISDYTRHIHVLSKLLKSLETVPFWRIPVILRVEVHIMEDVAVPGEQLAGLSETDVQEQRPKLKG